MQNLIETVTKVMEAWRQCEGTYSRGEYTERCSNQAEPESCYCAECNKIAEEEQ